MTLVRLVTDYGCLAVFVGAVLKSETILILAGFAAHQGHLSFPLVVAIALCGRTLGDDVFFFMGRRYGKALSTRFPQLSLGARRVNSLMLRYQAGVIIGMRFMFLPRITRAMAIGMSEVPAWCFILFNLIGAMIWAPLVARAGYLLGQTLEWLFAEIKSYEDTVLLLIISAALVFGLLSHLHRWRHERSTR